jgi:hypothetical protein
MGRQRRKVRRKHIRDTKKNRCGLHLAHLPLPFGTCIDLNTFTRILLYTSNQNLDDEWHKICQRLNQLDSDMHIFDNLNKCIEYIQQEHVKKLYLLVLKSNKMSIKNAQRNIIDAKKSSSMVRVRVKVRVMLTQHPQPHLTEQTHIIFVEILGTHLATFRCKTLTKHTKESTIIV